MANIAETLQPDQVGDAYPAGFVVGGVAGGAGDAAEVTSQGVSVLGTNAGSASAHGVAGVQYDALEAWFMVRATLADTESLTLENLMWQQADPNGSGDPGTYADVAPAADLEVDIITLGATPKTDHALVGVTAGVQDDITVATASGAVTNGLYLVRLRKHVRIPTGKEFWRLQWTPNASAANTDTFDIFQGFRGIGNTPAYLPINQSV